MTEKISDILNECRGFGVHTPEYHEKMIHQIPSAGVVNRVGFIAERCRDKVVLSLGCSGPAQKFVDEAAKRCYGMDKERQDREWFVQCDLDEFTILPAWPKVELVLMAEILEHLGNPQRLLKAVQAVYKCPAIITVPNAFSEVGTAHVLQGIENVNRDHVAYYSWKTLKTLVERCGYAIQEHWWYNGNPGVAEGLIFVVR